eukprot:s2325_g12.t1
MYSNQMSDAKSVAVEALHVLQQCARLHQCLRCVKVLLSLSLQRRGHSESSDWFSAESFETPHETFSVGKQSLLNL